MTNPLRIRLFKAEAERQEPDCRVDPADPLVRFLAEEENISAEELVDEMKAIVADMKRRQIAPGAYTSRLMADMNMSRTECDAAIADIESRAAAWQIRNGGGEV